MLSDYSHNVNFFCSAVHVNYFTGKRQYEMVCLESLRKEYSYGISLFR